MSFEGEFASYEPLRRLLDSEKVNELQKLLRIREKQEDTEKFENEIISKEDIDESILKPDLILAVDGSKLNHPVENGFPGAELGYITVASVLIDLVKVETLEKEQFINPKKFKETESVSSFESVFPGCNIILTNEKNAKTSLRRRLFEELNTTKIFSDGESLLGTYEYLFKIKIEHFPSGRLPKSPLEECKNEDMQYGYGEYSCNITGQKLFSTDALRLHELMNPAGSNGDMFGQIMVTLEKLFLINIIRYFEYKENTEGGWLKTLRRIAFILDGPLAVFSTGSWLAKVISFELSRINDLQKKINGLDLLVFGIEKSGTFFNHFTEIDTTKDGISDKFPKQSAFLLDDSYIKNNIIFSESEKPYGLDTYFGRKFFYKALSGQKIVPVVACYNDAQKDISTANISQFSRLGDIMTLLDTLVSSRYPNSISPLISAHAEAAIPLNLGQRIFEDMAREIRENK